MFLGYPHMFSLISVEIVHFYNHIQFIIFNLASVNQEITIIINHNYQKLWLKTIKISILQYY